MTSKRVAFMIACILFTVSLYAQGLRHGINNEEVTGDVVVQSISPYKILMGIDGLENGRDGVADYLFAVHSETKFPQVVSMRLDNAHVVIAADHVIVRSEDGRVVVFTSNEQCAACSFATNDRLYRFSGSKSFAAPILCGRSRAKRSCGRAERAPRPRRLSPDVRATRLRRRVSTSTIRRSTIGTRVCRMHGATLPRSAGTAAAAAAASRIMTATPAAPARRAAVSAVARRCSARAPAAACRASPGITPVAIAIWERRTAAATRSERRGAARPRR